MLTNQFIEINNLLNLINEGYLIKFKLFEYLTDDVKLENSFNYTI